MPQRRPMSENTCRIHDECAEERKKAFQSKHTIANVEVGDWLKFPFQGQLPNGSTMTEHMWVKVQAIAGTIIHGELDNDPEFIKNVKCGDKVVREFAEAEAICGDDD